ncbi:MAG: hypothetical protein M0Z53_02885 [Thermaerobacter sp.]|nr:hypothetical protein [Thermaerobacter sp.]
MAARLATATPPDEPADDMLADELDIEEAVDGELAVVLGDEDVPQPAKAMASAPAPEIPTKMRELDMETPPRMTWNSTTILRCVVHVKKLSPADDWRAAQGAKAGIAEQANAAEIPHEVIPIEWLKQLTTHR